MAVQNSNISPPLEDPTAEPTISYPNSSLKKQMFDYSNRILRKESKGYIDLGKIKVRELDDVLETIESNYNFPISSELKVTPKQSSDSSSVPFPIFLVSLDRPSPIHSSCRLVCVLSSLFVSMLRPFVVFLCACGGDEGM